MSEPTPREPTPPGPVGPERTATPRSVVVTGAGRGIGRGIATVLAGAGWTVVGVDRDPVDDGPWVELLTGDTRDPEVHRRAARAAATHAPVRGWVNNAGVTRTTPLHRLADPAAAEEVERTIRDVVDVNGLGFLWGCAAAVEAFLAHDTEDAGGRGAIVSVGSIHGRAAWTDHAAYEFTKGGIDALTRSIAVTYGAHRIRANTVAPGRIRTEAVDAWLADADDPDATRRALDDGPPLGRMGTVAEIGEVVAFLLSERASYLTGQSVAVDGGWTAQFGTPPPPDLG